MGDWETGPSGSAESPLGYHSCSAEILTCGRESGRGTLSGGQFDWAVASKRVTEAFKGRLSVDGNHAMSANAKAGLTVRQTRRAVTKVGVSDQVVVSGNAIA